MSNILELHSVRKEFADGFVAVDDLTLDVQEGEFLTILGPSGCGKSTTLRMIAGFEYPDRGRIFLNGEDVTDIPPNKRPVNMVFQDFALFPHMTVEQNIAFGLRLEKMRSAEIQRKVANGLETIELSSKAKSKPHELSIGQKQRVALMRALVRQPKMILLDEPMSALDVKLRESMQIEIRHLHRQLGITFVMVTHDQTEALSMSDRIMVMDRGSLVQLDVPTAIYDRPANSYVADFVGSSNLLPASIIRDQGGRMTVRFGSNDVNVAKSDSEFRIGDDVILAIRPERIDIVGTQELDEPDGEVFHGTFVEMLYQGRVAHLLFDVGAGEAVSVSKSLPKSVGQSSLPRIGDKIFLSSVSENFSVFKPSGADSGTLE